VGFGDSERNRMIPQGIVAIRNIAPMGFTTGQSVLQISTHASA
jgi:hypothetical protein